MSTTSSTASSLGGARAEVRFAVSENLKNRRLGRAEVGNVFSGLGKAAYTHVSLGGCCVGDGAASFVAEQLRALGKYASLRYLSMADCIASLDEAEALRTLSALGGAAVSCAGTISELDLSNNSLGPKGISALSTFLMAVAPRLRKLTLKKCGLSADTGKLLRAFLGKAVELVELNIDENAMGSDGLREISQIVGGASNLQVLSLRSLRADAESVTVLLTTLAESQTDLVELWLGDNGCNIDTALRFSGVFTANSGLKVLDLSSCNLSSNAAYTALRNVSESEVKLTHLNIAGNDLSKKNCELVRLLVETKGRDLVHLDISENNFGDDGIDMIMNALTHARSADKLATLGIASLNLSDLGAAMVAGTCRSFPRLKRVEMGAITLRKTTSAAMQKALGDKLSFQPEEDVPGLDGKLRGSQESGFDLKLAAAVARLKRPPALPGGPRSPRLRAQSDASGIPTGSSSNVATSQATDVTFDDASWRSGTSRGASIQASPASPSKGSARAVSVVGSPRTPRSEIIASPSSNAAIVVSSARQLRDQVKSLDREVSSLVGGIQSTSGSFRRESMGGESAITRRLSLAGASPEPKPISNDVLDILWAGVLAAFLLVVVLGIVQSQDEYTFTMKPV